MLFVNISPFYSYDTGYVIRANERTYFVTHIYSLYTHTPIHNLKLHVFEYKWRQLETRPKKVVLLTDSLSVLQSLASGNPEDYTLRNVIQRLNSLTSRTTAVLQWVPAHTGIHGNEVADQLAKEGSKKQQPKSKHDEDILNVQCM